MSGILEQAKAAASSAATTVSNAAVQAATTTQNLASQAYNSETTAQITEQAKALAGQAATATGGMLGQAGVAVHQGAHTLAPSIVPAPGVPVGGVDKSHDLEPESEADKAKLEKLFQSRPDASDLQEKGILKGEPGDSLAGKKAELEKSMLGDKLDKELASRPAPEELVKKGILNADETPGSQ